MCCSAAGVALKLGFFKQFLEFSRVFLIKAFGEKKTQVFDMFITFTVLIAVCMLCAHD